MDSKNIRVGLVGNPNVGKSTVFNALTKMNQHTGNWPGKTVESAFGSLKYKDFLIEIVDLPGTYSLISHSKEEEVTRDFICHEKYDAIIVVCDAVCLERNLNLVMQVLAMTSNVIVAVNLIDEAKKKHIEINFEKLSDMLETPVVPICARDKKGLDNLVCTVCEMSQRVTSIKNSFLCHEEFDEKIMDKKTEEYVEKAEKIAAEVVEYKSDKHREFDKKIDKILTNKITGIPIMVGMLMLIFWITIVGANYPSELLFSFFQNLGMQLYELFEAINVPTILANVLLGGGYKVLTWVVAVMLPPMAIFFPLFTILEDLGVLPRIAFNLDNTFRKCNACGKQALTMCMGFGCNACGVSGARIIDSARERLIAILTNSFVPCNGRFPTIISIITMFFVGTSAGVFSSFYGVLIFAIIILFSIFMTFITSKFLSKTVLKGEASAFTLELPPYRTPKWGSVIVRSIFDRTLHVLWRAVIIALPAGILIWILANVNIQGLSILEYCTNFVDPLAKLIGLDGVILMAFVLGFPANEIVLPIALMIYMSTGELVDSNDLNNIREILVLNGWTIKTAICTIIFSLMHWPCSTTCLTIFKETKSVKWTMLSIVLPTLCGICICAIVNAIFMVL
ncbi:MAG: ferrous iron transporter B [Clostridia bacterium]|nr:ferrous iron transporter B [Clostridia bacterium]